MFTRLEKYKNTNHFFFKSNDSMAKVCNAPIDKAGVYIVYALRKGKIDLIYIGRSGQVNKDESLFIRKGGIKDRLVFGKRDGIPRVSFWKAEMIKENMEVLDIYWYVTHDDSSIDCPRITEDLLLTEYKSVYGQTPLWNRT